MDKKNLLPELNIGMIGHVDHGKTTLTFRLTGKWTDTHSEEIKRGITIKLGYANFTIYKCNNCGTYSTSEICPECMNPTEISRTISIVDAPGHESLMATMLAGATIMHGALLLVAANEPCPQPQTREHLAAMQILGVKNIIVVQNKIDLVTKEEALENFRAIKNFLKGTPYENAPIIPISARYNANIDELLKAIETYIPTPEKKIDDISLMLIARSFDVNKPGTDPRKLIGGIIGGAIISGRFKVGDTIEIRPGFRIVSQNKITYEPIVTTIKEIQTDTTKLNEAYPGGSVAFLTDLDPAVVKSDQLAGSVVGYPGKLPPVWTTLKLELHLFEKVVGSEEEIIAEDIKQNEMLLLNVNAASTIGTVTKILKKNQVELSLKLPVCAKVGEKVAISRRISQRFRLIGYGIIME
ncbi:MAG: translation initiation factor IF-2 subunit gamma [Candidatus Woesearchaeota archaeon]